MKYYVIYKHWGSLENKYINIKTAAIKPLKGVIAAVFITYLVSINEYSYAILILFFYCGNFNKNDSVGSYESPITIRS